MAYSDIAKMSRDAKLRDRIIACAAQELSTEHYPVNWVDNYIWQLCAAQDWEDAYAYALGTNVENPGEHEGVINDGMILSRVQALMAELYPAQSA